MAVAGHESGRERHRRGDAERGTEVAHRLADGGSGSEAMRRQALHRGRRQLRQAQGDAETAEDHRRQVVADVVGLQASPC